MFPIITLYEYSIFVIGLGLILCLILFSIIIKYYTKKYGLKFAKFMAHLRSFLLLPYVLGRYVAIVVDTRTLFPFFSGTDYANSLEIIQARFLAIISPSNYNFHIVGVLLGFIFAFLLFRTHIYSKAEERKRIDAIFYGLSITSILAGIFFLFGDTWIGKPTDSIVGIEALSSRSAIYNFDGRVYPVGLFFSFVALFSYAITVILQNLRSTYGMGIIGTIFFIIGLNILFAFVDYPRIGFIEYGQCPGELCNTVGTFGYARDMLNYISFIICLFLLYYYVRIHKEHASKKEV